MDGLETMVADTLRWAEEQLSLVIAELEVTAAIAQDSQPTLETALTLQSTALESTRRRLGRIRTGLETPADRLAMVAAHGAPRREPAVATVLRCPTPCARSSKGHATRGTVRTRGRHRRPVETFTTTAPLQS